MKLTWPVKNDI